jgi:hypothetical protein
MFDIIHLLFPIAHPITVARGIFWLIIWTDWGRNTISILFHSQILLSNLATLLSGTKHFLDLPGGQCKMRPPPRHQTWQTFYDYVDNFSTDYLSFVAPYCMGGKEPAKKAKARNNVKYNGGNLSTLIAPSFLRCICNLQFALPPPPQSGSVRKWNL